MLRILFFSILIFGSASLLNSQPSAIDSIKLKLSKTSDADGFSYLMEQSQKRLGKDPETGLFCARLALKYAGKAGDIEKLCKAKFYTGTYFVQSGNLDSAIQMLSESARLSVQGKNLKMHISSLDALGNAFLRSGQVDSSKSIFRRVIDLSDTASAFLPYKQNALNALGIINYRVGNYKDAINQFIQLHEISSASGNLKASASYSGNIAGLFFSLKNYDRALFYYQKTLEYYSTLGLKLYVALTHENIGMVQKETGLFDSALVRFGLAEKTYVEFENMAQLANLYQNMAATFIATRSFSKADQYADKALTINETRKFDENLTENFFLKAHALFGLCQNNQAQVFMQKAHLMASKNGQTELQIKISKLGYEIHKALKNWSKSLQYLELHFQLTDSILNTSLKKEIADLEAKYETAQKEQKIQQLSSEKMQQELTLKNERRNKTILMIISLFVILSGIGLWTIYRFRQRSKQMELNKTRAELENRLLRAQMNPHFMFNSLNSVQSYITANQNELAEDFLSRFAMLTRLILNNSREEFIPFSDEILTLRTYMELEQQRYKHIFAFQIEIDEEIDEDLLLVPPMLVQPFVENAIIHGLAPLKQNGHIELCFKKQDGHKILCTITDNGIGREASAKINKGKHKSLGMQVTTDRLNLIASQTGVPIQINIEDLKDSQENAAGTKVAFFIPFKTT